MRRGRTARQEPRLRKDKGARVHAPHQRAGRCPAAQPIRQPPRKHLVDVIRRQEDHHIGGRVIKWTVYIDRAAAG